MKTTTAIITIIVLLLVGWTIYSSVKNDNQNNKVEIASFEECVTAGYPVMESYPRQCRASGGVTFTEVISAQINYVNATKDLIQVTSPTPNAKVTTNFNITGVARGTWYFEASFPVVVTAEDGTILFQAPAQAKSDWMTTEFVPFSVDVKLPSVYNGLVTVTLKKDNPSGLPEKDASISFYVNVGN